MYRELTNPKPNQSSQSKGSGPKLGKPSIKNTSPEAAEIIRVEQTPSIATRHKSLTKFKEVPN